MNLLYYGDNLDIMRRYIKDETVDLVYLDPPFNSNANYNVLFAEKDGSKAASQIQAFSDTWTWNHESEAVYGDIVVGGDKVSDCLQAFRTFLGECDMLAYLVMMAPRLVELRRVMKQTASIYLHCDPTASHYLKMLMDSIFGPGNFRNEIIWHYYNKFQRGDIKMFARDHDVILFYTKDKETNYCFGSLYEKRKEPIKQLRRKWEASTGKIVNVKDEEGHVVWKEVTERKVDDVWRLPFIVPASKEGLGYPTQKPVALLERVIIASSNPGDVVLDPFCGCGTTIEASQRLKRNWIGIDVTCLATNLIKSRLTDVFENEPVEYDVIGEPTSIHEAEELAASKPFQFQAWALGLVGARVASSAKKGADKGLDGKIIFEGDDKGVFENVIFSVKGGKIPSNHIREIKGVVEREKSAIGVLISINEPTLPMKVEAAKAGFYESKLWGKKYPKIQLLTVAELLKGKKLEMPPIKQVNATFKKAPKSTNMLMEQHDFDL